MPELPEVETIRIDLDKELKDRKILKVGFFGASNMLKPSPVAVAQALEGAVIKGFERRAKLLLMRLSSGKTVAIHLKLSGQLLLRKKDYPQDRFTRVVLELSGGEELRFNDLRKFGFMKVLKDKTDLSKTLAEFGPEPFTPEFTFEKFNQAVSPSKRAIKTVIMDQKKIAGVGNIYADESLWRAKIHPTKLASQLNEKELKDLFEAILFVLKEGIKDRGTSVDSYLDIFAQKGVHAKNLKVFRLNGAPCPRCGTIILKTRVGGRGTHFCPSCQKI